MGRCGDVEVWCSDKWWDVMRCDNKCWDVVPELKMLEPQQTTAPYYDVQQSTSPYDTRYSKTPHTILASASPFYKLLLCYYKVQRNTTPHNKFLHSTTACCKVLQNTTHYYKALQSTTSYYKVLQSITPYYRVLVRTTKYYSVLQNELCSTKYMHSPYYEVLLCTTMSYTVLLRNTWNVQHHAQSNLWDATGNGTMTSMLHSR